MTYQQSSFKRYHSDKHFSVFTYKVAAKINWHRYGIKITSLSPYIHTLRPMQVAVIGEWKKDLNVMTVLLVACKIFKVLFAIYSYPKSTGSAKEAAKRYSL